MTQLDNKLNDVVDEIRVNGAIIILGAGASFNAGMPLYKQLAPTVWQVIDEYKELKREICLDMSISSKELIGENDKNLMTAFSLIKNNQLASLKFKHLFLAINNSHNNKISSTHKNICKLIHEGFIKLTISLNWDDLLECAWTQLYGTDINGEKNNLIKPHGDVRKINRIWVFPNEPGYISESDLMNINQLGSIGPKTLIVIGYSENDEIIVKKIVEPNEKRWKVFRVSPSSIGDSGIPCTAEYALQYFHDKLISKTQHLWEYVDFSKQRNLGPAISGCRLSPSDVIACPRLPQLIEAEEKLEIAHYVFIKGEAGCGKSITAYQIAHDYLQNGWEIVKFSNSVNIDDIYDVNLPNSNYKTLYIIDDAQQIPQSIVTRFLTSSNEQQKVIITQTTDEKYSFESVIISNSESVKTLYYEYLKRRDEVLQIVQVIDNSIGDRYLDTPIEWKLKDASIQQSPWLFNYVLRGGWKQIRSQFLAAKESGRADILLTVIAFKQIFNLDKPVDKLWLYDKLKIFGKNMEWCNIKLAYLYSVKLIIGTNEIRTLHLESASKIIANYFSEPCSEEYNLMYTLIQKEISDNKSSMRGIIWFLNIMSPYTCSNNMNFHILTSTTVPVIIEHCLAKKNSEDRASAAHIINFIVSRKYGSMSFEVLLKNYSILSTWIENVDNTTAYAYSWLLNDIYNENHSLKTRFISNLNISTITNNMQSIRQNDLYCWGNFLDRLSIFEGCRWQKKLLNDLPLSYFNHLLESVTPDNVGGLLKFIDAIYILDKTYAFTLLTNSLPIIETAFKKNLAEAWSEFDFTALYDFCGFNQLSRSHPNTLQQNTTKKILSLISIELFSESITYGTLRDWERLYSLACLIYKYDKHKYVQIVKAIDLDRIDSKTQGLWEKQPHELILLCIFLASGDLKLTDEWIYSHREYIKELSSSLVEISPKTAEYLIANDGVIDICLEGRWKTGTRAIKRLVSYDKSLAIKVLKQNEMLLLKN